MDNYKEIELLRDIRKKQELNDFNICPRCGEQELRQPLVLNCLSKVDNKTYICEFCGKEESNHIGYKNLPVEKWWRIQADKIAESNIDEE